MLEVGDRVICILPFQTYPEVGSMGTVVFAEETPTIEFDEPFEKGHNGYRNGRGRGRPGHCWNFWDGANGYIEKVDANTKAPSHEKRTKQKVLAKIKLLEQRFETRQKEKQHANKNLSLQTGKPFSQSLGPELRRFATPSRSCITLRTEYW